MLFLTAYKPRYFVPWIFVKEEYFSMTQPMSAEEQLQYIYIALEKLQCDIELLRQQLQLLSKRVTEVEKLLKENPTLDLDLIPTKRLDR